jgi:hypothetical protein
MRDNKYDFTTKGPRDRINESLDQLLIRAYAVCAPFSQGQALHEASENKHQADAV